jgi:hypothetical protein
MPSNQPTGLTTHILDEWYGDRTFKAMLVGPDWTPNRTTSIYRSPLVAHEVTGTNWPAGGQPVDLAVSEASATYQSVVTLQSFTVANVTTEDPARYLVFYEVTGSASTDRIIRWHDLKASVVFTDQPFEFSASDVVHTTGMDR